MLFQVLLWVAVLVAWEMVPRIPGVARISVAFDPGFISSPSRVAEMLVEMMTGAGVAPVWPYVQETLKNALLGGAIGMSLGVALGLVLSNDARLSQVFRPYVVAFNSVPRIALIPVIVIVIGPNERTTIIAAALTGFFTVFFNAYEGGRTVARTTLESAIVSGASSLQLMRHVRLPFVAAWSVAALPNALSHSLLSCVTAEVLTGYPGLGRYLSQALSESDATKTFAIATILAVTGVALIQLSELPRRRWLHWWTEGRT